jgi:uncharacterized protein
VHLTLHLTEACNLRCRYCYAPHRDGPEMTLETALAALELGRRVTPAGEVCGVAFFGGEPLLRWELLQQVVEAGQDRGHRFKLTTNGLDLTDERLDWLVEHHVLVAMSLDGVAEAHDPHRRLPEGRGSHARLVPRWEALLARRPWATTLMVVNPDTAPLLERSVAFLVDRGARYLQISLNHAAAWSEADFDALERSLRALAVRYLAWAREGRKLYLSPFEMKLASHIQGDRWTRCRCALGERQLSVTPEGWLVPCVQFTRAGASWRLGHVSSGIDEAARARIRGLAQVDKAACEACGIRDRCFHTCGCLNLQATGSVGEVPPLLCRYEQLMVGIADELGAALYAERNASFLARHYDPSWPLPSLLEEL